MGRPQKQGLDYFPLDTTWETNMKLVKAKFGLLGIGCIIELYRAIYREGYAMKWDEDTQLLFSSEHGIPLETLNEIIIYSVGKGIFHAGKLSKLRSLTSRGIQKRWKKIATESKRSTCDIDPDLDLTFPQEETRFTPEETGFSGGESAQSKVKESKVKERILREECAPEPEELDSIFPDDPEPTKSKSGKAAPPVPETEHHPPQRFIKPKLEEVRAYCAERKNSVMPEKFLDHYESNGWMVGKTRMKDWQAAVRNWENNEIATGGKNGKNTAGRIDPWDQPGYYSESDVREARRV